MKKKTLSIAILLLAGNILFGQNLIQPVQQKQERNNDILNNRMAVTDYQQVEIDVEQIEDVVRYLKISVFDKSFEVEQDKLKIRGVKNFSWFGSANDKMSSITLSVMDEDVQGMITHHTDIYRIETINGNYYVTKIDQSKYPEEECGNFEKLKDSNNNVQQNENNQDNSNFQYKISGDPFTCRLRLLVLYATAAESATSNILNTIQLAVHEMNQSFGNSSINREVELVYVGETNYSESGSVTDLDRFWKDGDNHMDEVHNLRQKKKKRQADICVLMANENDYCGIAKSIKASAPNAFCLVHWDCATGNYSFAHKVGHLIGCQHNQNDIVHSPYPYNYAYGYKSPNNDWRTIMAYSCSGGCPRLQFWSNPNVNFGTTPMETATNNNARMINEKFPNIMSYLQPDNNVFVESNDVSNANEGNIIAKNKIENNGTVTIESGQSYSFRAGDEIVLKPGFTAEAGSEFVAEIVDVDDCGQPDGEDSDFGLDSDLADYKKSDFEELITEVSVYPNPVVNQDIVISFKLSQSETISIVIYDFLGKQVQNIGQFKVEDKFEKEIELSKFSKGTYFISISNSKDELLTYKFIKL